MLCRIHAARGRLSWLLQALAVCCLLMAGLTGPVAAQQPAPKLPELKPIPGAKPRNVIFILVDDHRYDALGYLGHPFLKTPNLDRLAAQGVHFANAFVTTSLCSPSRASILTGLYMNRHGVVDNNNPVPPGTIFFPQYLQRLGYETAFVGKWHMGAASDEPRPGFDYWVSFRGQGFYYPPDNKRRRRPWTLNVNGRRVPQKGYITDELTDYALQWLKQRDGSRPFFLYLSHKAVHGMFYPARRHAGRYAKERMPVPPTMANTPENRRGKPRWLLDQRNSWHGVEFAYHRTTNIEEYYRAYCEALLAVDESVGRIMQFLRSRGWDRNTLVIYMGDNGFQWGEHGLIDKRTAYEASMRVPMIAHCPELFPAGTVVKQMVANIDIAPTVLEAAGVKPPEYMDGRSFLQLAAGRMDPRQWRKELFYEYYWEWNFPQTPTTFAVRTDRYKFIQYHGIWDLDELYDLKNDPHEQHNLIHDPKHAKLVRRFRQRLHAWLASRGANRVPFSMKRGLGAHYRWSGGSRGADFPPEFYRDGEK